MIFVYTIGDIVGTVAFLFMALFIAGYFVCTKLSQWWKGN